MGCCLGTPAVNHRPPPKTTVPPPPFEEETVKEVLSETPIFPKPEPEPEPEPESESTPQILHPDQQQPKPQPSTGTVDLSKSIEIQENASDISEMYSFSESFSAATTTTTVADGRKDDEDEVTQKVKNKSPTTKKVVGKRPGVSISGELGVKKERSTRPLARRQMAPSPEKKRQSPPSRGGTTTNAPRSRNAGPSSEASRREPAARRSRSPAVRGETGQRRRVKETVEMGGDGEKGSGLVEKGGESERKRVAGDGGGDGGVLPETVAEVEASESLENPLVSLECFIFL